MAFVTHLIPYDGIGGVERAARSMSSITTGDISFRVETIFPPSASQRPWVVWNPLHILRTVRRLRLLHPDLVILSLWRAYFIGILVKLLRPSVRLVVFLHCPKDVHLLDRMLTRLAARLADRVWADAHETLARRLPALSAGKGEVISFVTERIDLLRNEPVRPVFVFWGRIQAQKGLSRSLRLFAEVLAQRPDACFYIIGPDGGALAQIRSLTVVDGLGPAVQFLGPMDFSGIREVAGMASFYLQTSELEGMGMSVVEAMQLGLVPVVTPVGEIGHYARQGKNAVVVRDDATAVAEVLALLDDDARFQTMRQGAIATWAEQPLYRDSVLAACRALLNDGRVRVGP